MKKICHINCSDKLVLGYFKLRWQRYNKIPIADEILVNYIIHEPDKKQTQLSFYFCLFLSVFLNLSFSLQMEGILLKEFLLIRVNKKENVYLDRFMMQILI